MSSSSNIGSPRIWHWFVESANSTSHEAQCLFRWLRARLDIPRVGYSNGSGSWNKSNGRYMAIWRQTALWEIRNTVPKSNLGRLYDRGRIWFDIYRYSLWNGNKLSSMLILFCCRQTCHDSRKRLRCRSSCDWRSRRFRTLASCRQRSSFTSFIYPSTLQDDWMLQHFCYSL